MAYLLHAGGDSGSGPSQWPPPAREPLPRFPDPTANQPGGPYAECWTRDPFDLTLPFTPPATPTLDFHRGNVCGHRVPGAPYVPGCTAQDPSLIFTWFLYEYPREWQERILDSYQAAGYTHIDFHRADWIGAVDGVPGCSDADQTDLIRRCTDRGLYVIVNLATDHAPPSQDDILRAADRYQAAGMEIACLAWQADELLTYPDLADYINWAGPALKSRGLRTAVQWVDGACAVWPFPQYGVYSRFDFMKWTSDKIDYPYQQFNTEMPLLDVQPGAGGLIGEVQDVLRSLANQKLVACEYGYQSQFDDPSGRLEAYCDLKGRALMATSWNGRVVEGGYLGGCRQFDGSVL